ncbi:hypothetical protein ACFRAR_13725 [Kitasatospora sp. NPDC056651]|uniref:hypothetical protein n=1 Tax=Kitasatospora sp. NPDC056651 TaxID=3345892 RepID=UPI00369DD396
MATSNGDGGGFGARALRYLESARNLVGCAGGAVGLGLHFAGLGGAWWPGVVAGLYGVGALLTPAPAARREPGPTPTPTPGSAGSELPDEGVSALLAEVSAELSAPAGPPARPPVRPVQPPPVPPAPPAPPAPDPELEALAAYLDSVPLPPSAGVDGLLTALRAAGPGPVAERIVRHRLPVAVAGYLRARTWQPWAGPGAPDPAAELGREVDLLVGELS